MLFYCRLTVAISVMMLTTSISVLYFRTLADPNSIQLDIVLTYWQQYSSRCLECVRYLTLGVWSRDAGAVLCHRPQVLQGDDLYCNVHRYIGRRRSEQGIPAYRCLDDEASNCRRSTATVSSSTTAMQWLHWVLQQEHFIGEQNDGTKVSSGLQQLHQVPTSSVKSIYFVFVTIYLHFSWFILQKDVPMHYNDCTASSIVSRMWSSRTQ